MTRNPQTLKRDNANKSLPGGAVVSSANGIDHDRWLADVERRIEAQSRSLRADAARATSWRVLQFVSGVTAFLGGIVIVYLLYVLHPEISMAVRSLLLVPIEGLAYWLLRQSRVDAENAKQLAAQAAYEEGRFITLLVLEKYGKPKDVVEVFKAPGHHPEIRSTEGESLTHKLKRRIARRASTENSAEEHSKRIH